MELLLARLQKMQQLKHDYDVGKIHRYQSITWKSKLTGDVEFRRKIRPEYTRLCAEITQVQTFLAKAGVCYWK